MFRKSKPQVAPPPAAPTIEEMLADLKTFEIAQPTANTGNFGNSAAFEHALLTEPENLALETWWQVFDEYEQKVRKLEAMEGTLDTQKEKLLACKQNLEEKANHLRLGINKQQKLIKEVVEC